MTSRGFTLIELLVSLAILAVLATLAFPVAKVVEQRRKEGELKLALQQIRGALDAYKLAVDSGKIAPRTDSGYPPDLQSLVNGEPAAKGSGHLYFLRRLPRDPLTVEAASDNGGWGLRSYASSADKPMPGADVFDVYSRSTHRALDGSEYRTW